MVFKSGVKLGQALVMLLLKDSFLMWFFLCDFLCLLCVFCAMIIPQRFTKFPRSCTKVLKLLKVSESVCSGF